MKSIAIIIVLASLSACSGMGMRDSSGASGTSGYGESGSMFPTGNPYNDPANIYFGA